MTAVFACQREQREEPITVRRMRHDTYWMVEGGGDSDDIAGMFEGEKADCFQPLPDGDLAVRISPRHGPEFRETLEYRLEHRLYAREPVRLEEHLGDLLAGGGRTLAVAESCTGGMVTARLSAVPGSSRFLTDGFVVYSNEAKSRLLGVDPALIQQHGAVSAEVALAMAGGALRVSGAGLAVAVTGIAGPDGGTVDKPVGLVFLAAVSREGETLAYRRQYVGARQDIRQQASQSALHLVRRLLPDKSRVGEASW
jgi:PncC family amidohydrolase